MGPKVSSRKKIKKEVDRRIQPDSMGIYNNFRKDNMTELEKLKKMLVSAHDELRARKQKNTPTFGAMMFMLQAIVQCNAALNEREKREKN